MHRLNIFEYPLLVRISNVKYRYSDMETIQCGLRSTAQKKYNLECCQHCQTTFKDSLEFCVPEVSGCKKSTKNLLCFTT